jgi:Fe-Mn family superoxide dismutase
VVDVFEHAYYIDYKNDRRKYLENWWNLVNWDEEEKKYSKLVQT